MNTTPHTSPMPAMLALCLLPSMFLLCAHRGNHVIFTAGVLLTLLPEGALLWAFGRIKPRPIFKPLLAASAVGLMASGGVMLCRFVSISAYLSAHRVSGALIALPVVVSAAYIASLSQGAQRRLCSAVLYITPGVFGAAALLALKNGSVTNLHLCAPEPISDLTSGLRTGAMMFTPALYLLTVRMSGHGGQLKTGRFVVLKALILLLFILPVIFALGEHISRSRLPSYDMAAFSKSLLIERFGGLYVLIFALSALVHTAVCANALRLCVAAITRKEVRCEKA
ncbi:MAG: hypothetical protein IKR76_10380 [Ruminococcus sp.]|nr:hypothetical protein [Ruminococcus sp.]